MKKTKNKILAGALVFHVLGGCSSQQQTIEDSKIRIGVTIYNEYDTFISSIVDELNNQVNEDKGSVILTIKDAEQSTSKQDQQVKAMIEDGCDVICVNLVDRTSPTKIIDLAKKNNIPIIFFNRELVEEDLQRWEHLYYVGAPAEQSGEIEGEIAIEAIQADPSSDKNRDGKIQYFILEGEMSHQDAIVRSEYSVQTIEDTDITLERLGYAIANWDRAQAQTKTSQALSEYGTSIELILANNDDMALGAIDAYKAAGISENDYPIIVGVDGTKVGLEAIQEGTLTGTAYNDGIGQADAMYKLAKALANEENISSLGLKDNKYIRIDYQKITKDNILEYISEE